MKALLIVVVLLLGLAVAADRVAVHVAEGQVATQIADKGGLHGKPTVQIGGFPVLTQALAGNYRDVHISLSAQDLGQPAGTSADVHLRGVKVSLSSVLSRSLTQVPVDSVDGTATLSYPLLAAQIGPDATVSKEGDQLRITRTVQLAGQSMKLTAAGQVTLKGNDLVVDVQNASGAGITLPSFLVERASTMLDLRYTVPALPFGLQLTSVTPEDNGLRITVEGRQTVLHG